ncbi:MAG TPA: TIM barrel protein [Nitriliruptorales bacterium]
MLVGASVPSRDPLAAAAEIGADGAQVHLSAPRAWKPPVGRRDADALRAAGTVLAAHAPYLCNPVSGNPDVRERTAANLQATLDEAERCGMRSVVVHAGHAAGGGSMQDAIERWLDVASRLSSPVPLLIENTASGATAPGRYLADIVALFEALRGTDRDIRIGSCFDTCHAWAGDPDAAGDPAGYVKAFAEATGGIDLLHVNDSKDEAGAGRDRHENLGAGQMGLDTLEAMVVTCAELGVCACIVETPSQDGGHERDLATIRRFLAQEPGRLTHVPD